MILKVPPIVGVGVVAVKSFDHVFSIQFCLNTTEKKFLHLFCPMAPLPSRDYSGLKFCFQLCGAVDLLIRSCGFFGHAFQTGSSTIPVLQSFSYLPRRFPRCTCILELFIYCETLSAMNASPAVRPTELSANQLLDCTRLRSSSALTATILAQDS